MKSPPRDRQAVIGLLLAGAIVTGWIALHVLGVFFLPLGGRWLWWVPVHVLLQTWLSVGLFIVAHDAMHGSLAPGHERLGRAVGSLCVGLYAAFPYRRLLASHRRHHEHAGTAADPDFHAERPRAFLPWFLGFFRTYFGWRQLASLAALAIVELAWGARLANLLLFWALPAWLSALQLFTVGTWLPHRHLAEEPGFLDQHRARTLDWPAWLSLLACFHFGRHLEHHRAPQVPWWRLAKVKAGE